jgi:acyl carrier protein
MVDTQVLTDTLKDFVYKKFPLAKKQGVKNSDPLLNSGIIDSVGILELVTFMEKEFGIHVSDEEMLPEIFQTLDALAAFVQQKGSTTPIKVDNNLK